MSPGEIAFLVMVVAALTVFAITLAYLSWYSSRSGRPAAARARNRL
jgi:hypothetical protein